MDRALPSNLYPDYFRSDLGLGGAAPNPFATALDVIFSRFRDQAHCLVHSMNPDQFRVKSQRAMLGHLGFSCDALNEEDMTRFYEARQVLVQQRGQLAAVEILADIYFSGATVLRGRPYERERCQDPTDRAMRICDSEDNQNIIFVRLKKKARLERTKEFERNGKMLLPLDYSLIVAMPISEVAEVPRGMVLNGAISMDERRL